MTAVMRSFDVIELPVENYLYRYYCTIYNLADNEFVKLSPTIGLTKFYSQDNSAYQKYVKTLTKKQDQWTYLRVQIPQVTEKRKYAFIRLLRAKFNKSMMAYVKQHAIYSLGENVKSIILSFLHHYGISEDEFNLERAVRRWHRSDEYQEYLRHLYIEEGKLELLKGS
ncbi:hypothetical protein V6R21_07670 [Limibacter armeniacum]|uniref:hypothetical protein n=1 Tax=Limibacter armeniacum TaxID=466084 RepID=UPI002FE5196D